VFYIHALKGYFGLYLFICELKYQKEHLILLFHRIFITVGLGSCWALTARVLGSVAGQCVGFVVDKVAVGQGFL